MKLVSSAGGLGCAVGIALLVACSNGGDAHLDEVNSASSPSTPSATVIATPGSADTRTYTDPGAGVSFEIGTDWHELDPLLIETAAADSAMATQIGADLGLSSAQLQQLAVSNLVALATSEAGGSLTLVLTGEPLRPSSAIERYYEDLGATEVTSEAIETTAGKGVRVDFSLEVDGTVQRGHAACLEVDGSELVITFSGADQPAIDAEFARVAASVRPADTTSTFEIKDAHVTFELPVGWEEVSLSKLRQTLTDAEATKALVARTGFTRAQLEAIASSGIPLFIVGPRSLDGYSPNLSCGVVGDVMPTPRAAVRGLRPYHVGDIRTARVTTAVGDGFAVTFTALNDARQLFNERLWVDVRGQIVEIGVAETDQDNLATIVDEILESLAPAD